MPKPVFAVLFIVVACALVNASPIPQEDVGIEVKFYGEISVESKPLKTGRLLVYTPGDQIVGCLVKDGKYNLMDPPVGKFRVTIDGDAVNQKYGNLDTSGLTVELGRLANRIDFELVSQKK